MENAFKNSTLFFLCCLLSLNSFSQIQKVYMDEFGLPFTWELPINNRKDYGVSNKKPGKYRLGVKLHFLAKINVGENITANFYDGDLTKRMLSTKQKLKDAQWKGYEMTFIDETENSFIKCNTELNYGQSTYTFYGFLKDGGTEYDFESPSYPASTYYNCTELSKAFKTIYFTTPQPIKDPISLKLYTNKFKTTIQEGDTLEKASLVENEVASSLANNAIFKEYDILKIGIYVLSDMNQNENNETIFFHSLPVIEKQYNLKEVQTFYKNSPVEDLIEGKRGTTYYKSPPAELGLYQTVDKAQLPVKVVTIINGYKFLSEGQFKQNQDGTIGEVLGSGPSFYLK